MSCAYDSIGWGAHFGAAVSPQQQWQTYFTADMVCGTAAGCTCDTTSVRACSHCTCSCSRAIFHDLSRLMRTAPSCPQAQPSAAEPPPQPTGAAAGQSPATAAPAFVPSPSPLPTPNTAAPADQTPPTAAPAVVSPPPPPAPTAAPAAPALAPALAPGAGTPASPVAAASPPPGPGTPPVAGPSPPEGPAPLVTFDAAVVSVIGASSSDIESSMVAAVQSAAAPVPVTVTVAETAVGSSSQRRLLQASWSMQASVNFTIGNLTASLSEADVAAIVAHDIAVFLQPVAVATSETGSLTDSGNEYAFAVSLPPSDQLGDQPAGFGALRASRLTDALQHAPSSALGSLAAVSAFTVAGVDARVAVVQAQAGPASPGIIPPLPPMQGLSAAPAGSPAAPPATPPSPVPSPPAPQPLLYTVHVSFPASQTAAAEALLAAVQGSPSIFPSTMAVAVSNAVLGRAAPPAAAPSTSDGAAIESAGSQACTLACCSPSTPGCLSVLPASMPTFGSRHLLIGVVAPQGGSNGVSGALYATSMELSAALPLLPCSRSEEALLVAALQGTPTPSLAAADVAVSLGDGAAGGNGTAAVYAFGPSQPGVYLVAVRPSNPYAHDHRFYMGPGTSDVSAWPAQVTSPANYTGRVSVSLPSIEAVAPLKYLVAEPSQLVQACATAWRVTQLLD